VLCSSFVVFLDWWLVDLNALRLNDVPDSLLELDKILRRKGIGFGNDWDEVDTCAEPLHDLDVEGLEGVASGADKVQTGMYSKVDLVVSAWLLLLQHVRLVLVIEELDDGLP